MTQMAAPDSHSRWRCAQCGNLTRFDVVRSARTSEFWHFDLNGDHRVETSQNLAQTIESVTCRWCGSSKAIELVARPEVPTD